MKKLARTLIITMVLIAFNCTQVLAYYENVPEAGIAINGTIVDGIKPIKISGQYFLPFTHLSRLLGYNDIRFESGTRTYQVTDGSTVVRLTMGGTRARRGDEFLNIDPPRWINETAYVSLSAGSSLFNSYIYFKSENGSIQIEKPANRYIVRNGDSLWLIAEAHHTTVARIKAVNNITSNVIYPGQLLKIPPREHTREVEPIKERTPIIEEPITSKQLRSEIVEIAKRFIGGGYKFGATLNEAPRLFDCSSYTQYVFRQKNIQIPRTSREQAGIGVPVTSLQHGDLLFFTSPSLYSDGRVGHVGIYMDGGHMIHASSSKGVHITYNVMSNSYWSKNYLFAKRVIQ